MDDYSRSPSAVANFFILDLRKNKISFRDIFSLFFFKKKNHKKIKLKRLMSLVFFADYHYRQKFNKSIFNERFKLKGQTVVLPSLYHEFKRFGPLGISELSSVVDFSPEKNKYDFCYPALTDGNVISVCRYVFDKYNKESTECLSKNSFDKFMKINQQSL